MRTPRKLVVLIVSGFVVVMFFVTANPPIGKRLSLADITPQSISISRWKPEPVTVTDANRCQEIIQQLCKARRCGAAHKCAPIAVVSIQPASGPPITLPIAPGHWFQNLDVFYGSDAYSLSPSEAARIFELAESK